MPVVSTSRYLVTADWDDVPHLTEEMKEQQLASMPPHMRDARSKGIPALGAGAIYPINWDDVEVKPFAIPDYWPKAFALDVGWKKTAALWGAWDRSSDCIYVYSEHYMGEAIPIVHAASIKARGDWIPGVIDPAARGRSQVDGTKLVAEYKGQGLKLRFADNAVEAGLYAVLGRLTTGRLKIFSNLKNLRNEYMRYHRDEKGKIVKEFDHLIDCLRYLVMSGADVAKVKPVETTFEHRPTAGDKNAGY